MASSTPEVSVPANEPSAPGRPVTQPIVNQSVPPPDARDVAASSKMPNIPTNVAGSSSKLSSITAALGYNRFLPITFGSSTFVPNWYLFSIVLSAVDRIMVNTYRFHQSNPDWHPVISQLYYGIIFVIHILRVNRSNQTITIDESNFLEWFESNMPFSSLPVAGPLKHFLQSITAASGPSNKYGNICPLTPQHYGSDAAHGYVPIAPAFNATWPPVPLYMDIINDMLHQGARNNFATNDPTHWQRFFLPLTHSFGAANPDEYHFGAPGITDLVWLPSTAMPQWYESAQNMMFPPRLTGAAVAATTTIAEYLRFGTAGVEHTTWIPSVVGMMQRHAQFLKDSTSLASISTVGLGASLPIITISNNPNINLVNAGNNQVVRPVAAVAAVPAAGNVPATPGHAAGFRATRFTHFKVTATSKSEDLHLLAEQFSLLSCVNVDFAHIAQRGNHYAPLPNAAAQRAGPYWQLPNVKNHTEIDVYGQIVTFLTGAFHNDQRMNK